MSLKTVKGNLISMAKDGQFDVIVHGCNCFNAMGAGIAAEIAKRCPMAKSADLLTESGNKEKLGKITYAFINDGSDDPFKGRFVVVNAYTQYQPGANFRMTALKSALKEIKKVFGNGNLSFGFPMIGAGIGGGDWNSIRDAIASILSSEDVTIVEFDGSK